MVVAPSLSSLLSDSFYVLESASRNGGVDGHIFETHIVASTDCEPCFFVIKT